MRFAWSPYSNRRASYRTPASQLSLPLAISPVVRTRLHTRRVTYEGFQRDDGLFDIEGHLTDVKDQDFALLSGLRTAGEAIHDMWVRVTVGSDYVIRAIEVKTDEMPYPGACDEITPAYSAPFGSSCFKGFGNRISLLLVGGGDVNNLMALWRRGRTTRDKIS